MLNAAGEQYNRDQIQKYKDDAKKLISKKEVLKWSYRSPDLPENI